MKLVFTLTSLLLASQSSFAVTFAGAGENLLYFEYAKQSADYCEIRSASARHLFTDWNQKNAHLYQQSIEAIRVEAKQRGLNGGEQDVVVSEAIENQRKLAKENIAKKGVPCEKFGPWLNGFSSFLKQ